MSHQELREAKNTIKAYEEIQELSRIELLSISDKLEEFSKRKYLKFDEIIKRLLDKCTFNEERVIEIMQRKYSKNNIYSSLLYILVHYEFSEEEAKKIWDEVKKLQIEMKTA